MAVSYQVLDLTSNEQQHCHIQVIISVIEYCQNAEAVCKNLTEPLMLP